jgi:hypothetical protein
MMPRGKIPADGQASAPVADVVEVHLLVPAQHAAALEAVAARLELTVGTLIRRAVSDFLQSPADSRTPEGQASSPGSPLSP